MWTRYRTARRLRPQLAFCDFGAGIHALAQILGDVAYINIIAWRMGIAGLEATIRISVGSEASIAAVLAVMRPFDLKANR